MIGYCENINMYNKFDTTTRERLYIKSTKNNSTLPKTSSNITDQKVLDNWIKLNNSKKGGKSRHYIKI